MASNTSAGNHRLSFAKIASMVPPGKAQCPTPIVPDAQKPEFAHRVSSPKVQDPKGLTPDADKPRLFHQVAQQGIQELSIAVESVRLSDIKGVENSSIHVHENGVLKREASFEDDRTHLSTSSTKPTSLDSKSVVSVTTFAMDEKDSLRPDDSASVQALDEEESLSEPASGAPNSVTGSEEGARGRRNLENGTRRLLRGVESVLNVEAERSNGPISHESGPNHFLGVTLEACASVRGPYGFPLEPDEKLLEAMKTPKDRLLILQLEEKIRHFIRESKEQSLELPPSNAFGRLLAHKLGDYYHLTHFVDNNVTSVRLHRTPFCRLPTALSAVFPATNDTTATPLPAMKIMRRTGQTGERQLTEGSTEASSAAPSKTTSEADDSGNDGERGFSFAGMTSAKDRLTMTREEREAKYQEARERIFRDFSESKSSDGASGDHSANLSRSSSASGRKKTFRQKTPHDDTFEARSQFNPYYSGTQYAHEPTPYSVPMSDGAYPHQSSYVVGAGVSPTSISYVSTPNGPAFPAPMNVNSVPQYPMPVSPQMSQNAPWQSSGIPQQSNYPGYTSMSQSQGIMGPQSSARSSPMTNYDIPYQHTPPNWPQTTYSGNYTRSANRCQPQVHWPTYSPQPMPSNQAQYSYVQYPGQAVNLQMQNIPTNPHPPPVSFGRSGFNPQTRSFVPGATSPRHPGMPGQPTMSQYLGPHHNSPNHWAGYLDTNKQFESPSSPSQPPGRIGPTGNRDSIAKWGTPAHLPPKPPPSQFSSDFDLRHQNANLTQPYANNSMTAKSGPLVVSGGAPLAKPN